MTFIVIKTIFIILDILIVGLFIFSVVKSWQFRPNLRIFPKKPRKAPSLKTEAFQEHWQSILAKLEAGDSESMKVAIIEADALVADLLKEMGYEGEHLADRLARLRTEDFPSVEKVWRAHRIRNELVHTPGFQISQKHARDMIEAYEKFLKEAGIL